jgi:long-chain acyl-CoA synthetase
MTRQGASPANLAGTPDDAVTVADIARQSAALYSDRTAYTLVMPNGMFGNLSFNDVNELSDDFAAWLREVAGLSAGDRVAVQLPNCLAYPVAVFGVAKAGCVLVNTNPLYTASEMGRQFADAGVSALVIVDMFADKLAEALRQHPIPHVVLSRITERMPGSVAGVIRLVQKVWDRSIPDCNQPHTAFAEVLAAGRKARTERGIRVTDYTTNVSGGDLCCLQYTGGTTGVSKGAMLSHANLLANVRQAELVFGGGIDKGKEVLLTALPLYHIFAFTANMLLFQKWGARNLLIPNPRPISNLKRAFENYPVTWMTGVNTLFNALLNEFWFAEDPPRSLKGAVAGGMALQAAVAERWKKVTGVDVYEGYGLTEASPAVTFNGPGRYRPATIGLPLPDTEVVLLDDEGRKVATGQPGELAVRGPQVMSGYWQKPDETAKILRDGWLMTGDVAMVDGDGFLKIVDRKKDMILVSGFNVYPNEVEDVLATHPGILECAVIGLPDGAAGEAVTAFVVKRDEPLSPDQVREFCKAHLTAYKVPRRVEFRDSLPKSNVGKILRKDLRAEFTGKA